jgi:hypothetical protein
VASQETSKFRCKLLVGTGPICFAGMGRYGSSGAEKLICQDLHFIALSWQGNKKADGPGGVGFGPFQKFV